MLTRASTIFQLFFLLLNYSWTTAQSPKDTSIILLKNEVTKFSKDASLKNAKWGICVITADSNKTVCALNDSLELTPASTMKAINTAAALSLLGKDYTFKTYLFYSGKIDSAGTLHGNIYIKGGGDPTLGSPRIDSMSDMPNILQLWTKLIKKQGIKKIDGAIVGDADVFDDTIVPPSWVYGDLGNYYGAGASGLTFHENVFRIVVKSGKGYLDSARVVQIDPPIPYITIKNKIYTSTYYAAEDTWVYGGPYDNTRVITGSIPKTKLEYSMRASLPDASYFCAYYLTKTLSDSGIAVSDSATTYRILKSKGKTINGTLTVFYSRQSPPLDTIIYYTDQHSINTYAEDILKILAYEKTGVGSTSNGVQLVKQFWKDKGVDLTGFVMKDGSGLSPDDKVSPRQLAEIMRAYLKDSMFPVFYNALPVAGRSGTIEKIFKGTIAENNLHAKSGYMIGLRSYTGYVYNKKNKLLTFGIIVNSHTASADEMRSMLEKIMVRIAETEW
ncbi:MAG: D-alanyl-D-alanine carboxypeptidase/D-alanyl-D-alanine-endopeptidase [Bacteroidales bacterium]|jgi:D-alanyl-D-alanine carboxypeptidase/D-alanyl-D-alanine-endopeptidase (penicillin-binding protein 4)